MLAGCLIFQINAAAQVKTPDVDGDEAKQELKQATLQFLSSVVREAQQFSLPENRVRAQTIAANLVWEQDEPAARQIFQNALGELQKMFAETGSPDIDNIDKLTTVERSDLFVRRYKLAELRRVFILTLTKRDSQAALDALSLLKLRPLDRNDPLVVDKLELQITTMIVKKSPEKSYAIAKEQLDTQGISYEFIDALKTLHQKDPKLASDLAGNVIDKIRTAKIKVSPPTGTAPQTEGNKEIGFWQVTTFATAAGMVNRAAEKDKTKKLKPLLSETDMKELVGQIANAYLNSSETSPYSISGVMSEIKRYAPELDQRIRTKLGTEASRTLDGIIESNSFYYDSLSKSVDELVEDAGRAKPEIRDYRYSFAATRALRRDEPEKAREIANQIKNRKDYAYLFEQIQTAEQLAKARSGNLKEVRTMLSEFKTNDERVEALVELAATLTGKGDKETAMTLLDESLQMVPSRIRKKTDLLLIAKIADVYSSAEPEQAFALIENVIAQSNEYINSGVKMDEFNNTGETKANELLFGSMNKQFQFYIPNSFELLKNLGHADLERAVGLADRFERPEIRLFVRLRIAQALLDAEASKNEAIISRQIEDEEEDI